MFFTIMTKIHITKRGKTTAHVAHALNINPKE
jgi:hypothetical protein